MGRDKPVHIAQRKDRNDQTVARKNVIKKILLQKRIFNNLFKGGNNEDL